MMRPSRWLWAGLLLAAAPVFAAPESCENVKNDISQRIVNNGVPESGFVLDIVPADQTDKPDAQVVGHCANDTWKILYTRTSSGNSAGSGAMQDGARTEPQ